MDKYKENSYREKTFLSDSTKLDTHYKTYSKPVLGTIMTLTCLFPILFCSCIESADNVEPSIRNMVSLDMTKGISTQCIENLDIFTFDDDRLMKLDSYLRTDASGYDRLGIHSRSGDKIVFICANSRTDRYGWSQISSYTSLHDRHAILEEEDIDALLMTGHGKIKAGNGQTGEISIRPVASEINLRSISCDFRGKSYEGEMLKNICVYLVNVNSRCSITAEGKVMPTHIINSGGLNEDDISRFRHPEIIFRKLGQSIGVRQVMTDIRLLCYPNGAESEGPGSPFTRLVIEGEIEGEKYWWPIDINREDESTEKGIFRNCRYTYDVVIRRKGMNSPDTPASAEDIDISIEIQSWDEKDSYSVGF